MSTILLAVSISSSLLASQAAEKRSFETDTLKTSKGDLTVTFVGHATLIFNFAGKTIHVDPVGTYADYSALPKADYILVTHEHRDHFDPKAIEQISTEKTELILTEACFSQIKRGTVMKNGDRKIVKGLAIAAVPAYNLVHMRGEGVPFHPKGRGNGYVIAFADINVYVAGDTENIPEMAKLKDIGCAFLPMNVPYTMTPEMAADAARAIKPAILYPYHFGNTDTSKLTALLKDEKGIEVRIRKMK